MSKPRLTRDDLQTMTRDERRDLLELLCESLEHGGIEASAEQEAELKRRIDAFEADGSGNLTWEELRGRLAADRKL
jgi:putative addiction module component (TIGR02574 family)